MTSAARLTDDIARFAALDGPTGAEDAVADALAAALAPFVDRVERDALGSVVAYRGARSDGAAMAGGPGGVVPRLIVSAPLDEQSLIVAWIDPGGFVRFRPHGMTAGADVRVWLGQPVTVHGRRALPGVIGTRPPHVLEAAVRDVTPEVDALFVDVGLGDAAVRDAVAIGDGVTFRRAPERLAGGRWTGKAMAGRALLAVLVEIAARLADTPPACDVVLAGAAQGALGQRGGTVLGRTLAADAGEAARTVAVALGATSAQQRGVDVTITLGGGPTIVRGPNVQSRLFEALVGAAKRGEIPHQIEALPGVTRTEATALHPAGAGIPCAVVQLPVRYAGTAVEVVVEGDVARIARLVAAFAADLDAPFVAALPPAVASAGSPPDGGRQPGTSAT